VDCEYYKNAQVHLRYHYELDNYKEYSGNFRKYVFKFINGEITAAEALDTINDMLYIHKITLNTDETSYGLILFIVTIVLSLIFIGSSILIVTPRFKPLFKFLPIDFWYVILLGILCHMASVFTEYGEVLQYKCQLKIILYSIGYTLILVPFLYKLITNFPEINKNSTLILNNRYIFLSTLVLGDIVLAFINLLSSYGTKTITPDNGKKYQECKMNDTLSKVMLYLIIGYKVLIVLGIGFFCFIEWNIDETKFDIHLSISTIYINILSIIVLIIFKYIKFSNYIVYCILNKIFILIIVLSNYYVFIGIRIAIRLIKKKDDDPFGNIEKFKIKQYVSNSSSPNNTYTSTSSNSGTYNYKKVIGYHYQTSITRSHSQSQTQSQS